MSKVVRVELNKVRHNIDNCDHTLRLNITHIVSTTPNYDLSTRLEEEGGGRGGGRGGRENGR